MFLQSSVILFRSGGGEGEVGRPWTMSHLTSPRCQVSRCRAATCQGNVREKQNFLQVREKSGNFEKMSMNFGHFTYVRELSGNFVVSCQGIVKEFYYNIIFRLNPASYDKGSTWVVFM